MLSKLINCTCGARWASLSPLVIRVPLGLIFMMHGYQKVFDMGIPAVTGFLGGLGFPMASLFAYILAYGELVFGIMMILGLFTHWIAKYHVIVALVALVVVHLSKGFFVSNGGYEFILLILAASISVLLTGPGKWSLDEMWIKKNVGSAM